MQVNSLNKIRQNDILLGVITSPSLRTTLFNYFRYFSETNRKRFHRIFAILVYSFIYPENIHLQVSESLLLNYRSYPKINHYFAISLSPVPHSINYPAVSTIQQLLVGMIEWFQTLSVQPINCHEPYNPYNTSAKGISSHSFSSSHQDNRKGNKGIPKRQSKRKPRSRQKTTGTLFDYFSSVSSDTDSLSTLSSSSQSEFDLTLLSSRYKEENNDQMTLQHATPVPQTSTSESLRAAPLPSKRYPQRAARNKLSLMEETDSDSSLSDTQTQTMTVTPTEQAMGHTQTVISAVPPTSVLPTSSLYP